MNEKTNRCKPTGLRSLSFTEYQTTQASTEFAGITDLKPGQILALVKQSAPALSISEKCIYLLDQLMAYTRPQDWLPGRRPIVWPSNERLAEALGIQVRALQYRLRALREAGLIIASYGPQERRYGRRGADNHIIEAYGLDLSPLALRVDEFKSVIEVLSIQRAQRKSLRRRRTMAIKQLKRITQTALDHGLDERQWHTLGDKGCALAQSTRTRDISRLKTGINALEHVLADARHLYETQIQLLITCEDKQLNAPKGAKHCSPNTTTTQLVSKPLDTVASKSSLSGVSSDSLIDSAIRTYKITPGTLRKINHNIASLLPIDNVEWAHVTDLAGKTYRAMHIPEAMWQKAIRELGVVTTAVMLMIVIAKRLEIRSTAAYFQGMLNRGINGDLNIGPTLFALRERTQDGLA